MTAYALVVMSNAVAGRENEFNDWYNNRHLGDILAIEGFTKARRFKLVDGPDSSAHFSYLAIYEIESENIGATMSNFRAIVRTDRVPISSSLDPEKTVSWLYETIDRVH